jgi:branched-chain amino acid transport system substrate-binding protein
MQASLAVILKIEAGSFDRGFPFSLKILDQGRLLDAFEGHLPPAPALPTLYEDWKRWYESLGQSTLITIPTQVTNVKVTDECLKAAQQLTQALNEWLNHAAMRSIERRLLRVMPQAEGLKFFIQTNNFYLKRFPWQLWDLFEQCYPDAEVILSAEFTPARPQLKLPVRILAIEGDVSNTNATLNLRPIEAIPGTQVTRLNQPSIEALRHELWSEAWDILIFVGHSQSQAVSHSQELSHQESTGAIALNAAEVLSLDDLHDALQHTVRNGLQLAIFNSCDGVGIASKLANLKIPYTIVMREQVPDTIAQTFLQTFLIAFSKGKSLHRSIHTARCKLQEFQSQFPYATWLPVIYQNPGVPEIRYPRSVPWRKRLLWMSGVAALLSGITMPYWQQFTPWSPETQDYLRRSSSGEDILVNPTLEKKEGATAFQQGDFKLAAQKFKQSLNLSPNDPEALIYYNNAILRDKAYKTHRIAVSVPLGKNPNVAQEMLRGVAQAQEGLNNPFTRQGLPIELVIVNDDNDPAIVENMARHLGQDRSILGVIGHNASDASVAAAPIYNRAKVVMLTPTSFSDRLSGSGDYTFRMVPSIGYIAQHLAEYARVQYPGQAIAVCADYGSIDNESYKKRFIEILQSSTVGQSLRLIDLNCDVNKSGIDQDAKIAEMQQAGATVLMVAPHIDRINRAIPLLQAAHREKIALLGSSTFYTEQTLAQGGEAIQSMVLSVPWMPTGETTFEQVAQGMWGGRVAWRTAMSYDALQVFAAGLNREPSREGLRQALQDPKFEITGATGSIRFSHVGSFQGDRVKTNALGALVKIQSIPGSRHGVDFVRIPNVTPASSKEASSKEASSKEISSKEISSNPQK